MSRQANQKLRKRLVPKHSAHTKSNQSNPYSWEFKIEKMVRQIKTVKCYHLITVRIVISKKTGEDQS